MSQIIIDPSAANADIAKINQAIEKLTNAQRAVQNLNTRASEMNSQTGSAIVEKCSELNSQLQALEKDLNTTITLINKAVQEYYEKDADLAAEFGKGGV